MYLNLCQKNDYVYVARRRNAPKIFSQALVYKQFFYSYPNEENRWGKRNMLITSLSPVRLPPPLSLQFLPGPRDNNA